MESLETITSIGERLLPLVPYVMVAGLLFSSLSILFVLLDPSPKKSVWRVAIAVVVIVLFVLLLILFFVFVIPLAKGGAA